MYLQKDLDFAQLLINDQMEEEKQMQEEEENCQRGDGDDQVVEENFEKSTVDATNADQKGDFSNASDFISESPRPVSPWTLIN